MITEKVNNIYLKGAINLINSLELRCEDGLIIMSNENNQKYCSYILEAAKSKKMENIFYIVIPEIYRPITHLSEISSNAIKNSKGLIYISTREVEEDFTFNRPLQDLCIENKVRYVYTWDAKLRYLKEGIAGDYNLVDKKIKNIKKILGDSKEIKVTSKLGTDLLFSVYTENILPRSPVFPKNRFWNQAPEGEVMSCPIENSFNGRLVVDGVITGMGEAPNPIIWDFKNGRVVNVKGNKEFLERLLNRLKKSDKRLHDLKGMWVAEFAIGGNDWARFDDNISNCEKVSGGVHFAMGNSEGLGVDRGEKYHFDNIIKSLTVLVTKKNGEKHTLIEPGKIIA